jgi:hypothetical protein
MKKNSFGFMVAGCVMVFATFELQAIPTPISGTLSFAGSATTDTGNFLTATRFVRFDDVSVGVPSSLFGDYVGTAGANVTVTPFIWNPPGASTPINPLWTFMSGGNTYSFDLSMLHTDFASPTGLLLSGLGTARITGPGVEKIATSGYWNLSAQTFGVSTFTFSSTTQVPTNVVDGGSTAMLLGLALCAFGLVQRKLKA